jgi:hypothetical protein
MWRCVFQVDVELMGTPPGTAGGTMTIGGKGFGPLGTSFVTSVRLGRLPVTERRRELRQLTAYVECYDPVVTVADVRIECTIPEGEGADGDLQVRSPLVLSGEIPYTPPI